MRGDLLLLLVELLGLTRAFKVGNFRDFRAVWAESFRRLFVGT